MFLPDWWTCPKIQAKGLKYEQGEAAHKALQEANRTPASLLVHFVLPVEKQITIIILTTISGICAQVERNKRQNETQLNFRDVPKEPKNQRSQDERRRGHRFEYPASPPWLWWSGNGDGNGHGYGYGLGLELWVQVGVEVLILCGWATCNNFTKNYTLRMRQMFLNKVDIKFTSLTKYL